MSDYVKGQKIRLIVPFWSDCPHGATGEVWRDGINCFGDVSLAVNGRLLSAKPSEFRVIGEHEADVTEVGNLASDR